MTLEELVGSKFVFGVPGTQITPDDIRHFKETHCSGLILYRINFEAPDQLRTLISDLESAVGKRLIVCADHEGGRVVMFGDGVTIFPSSQAFGQTGNTQLARHHGEIEGRELRRLGIDVNFAPVLDVLTEAYSPNIGIRSFGKDPELVAKMGAARLSAMQVEQVSACAKHFPGLGPATLDPHLKLPTISVTWDELERVHMTPFLRAMRTAVHSIMTSHPLYPGLDPTPGTPATFSRKIVHEYLRQKVGYKGVIFSDDLEMGAITEICPIGEAAVRTVQAGHDMLLVCHKRDAQRAAYDAVLAAAQTGKVAQKELEESHKRIEMLRGRWPERFTAQPATPARADKERQDALSLVAEVTSAATTVLRQGPSLQPGVKTLVVFPNLGARAHEIVIEKELVEPEAFLTSRLSSAGISADVRRYSFTPTPQELEAVQSAAAGVDQILFFVYDAHIHPAETALLESLRGAGKRLVVVLLLDVYDAEYIREGTLCLTNYGARVCDIDAALKKAVAPAATVASGH